MTLLFGISSFNNAKNTSIVNTTIDYILLKDLMSLLPTPDLFQNISTLKKHVFQILLFKYQIVY